MKAQRFHIVLMLVGTGRLVLFGGTPLIKDMEEGKWISLNEKEMLEELLIKIEYGG